VEGQLHAYRYVGSGQPWQQYSEVDTVNNTVTAYGVEPGVWGLGVAADYPTVITLQTSVATPISQRAIGLGVLISLGLGLLVGVWIIARRRKRRCL
jgi:hypothetical protein